MVLGSGLALQACALVSLTCVEFLAFWRCSCYTFFNCSGKDMHGVHGGCPPVPTMQMMTSLAGSPVCALVKATCVAFAFVVSCNLALVALDLIIIFNFSGKDMQGVHGCSSAMNPGCSPGHTMAAPTMSQMNPGCSPGHTMAAPTMSQMSPGCSPGHAMASPTMSHMSPGCSPGRTVAFMGGSPPPPMSVAACSPSRMMTMASPNRFIDRLMINSPSLPGTMMMGNMSPAGLSSACLNMPMSMPDVQVFDGACPKAYPKATAPVEPVTQTQTPPRKLKKNATC